MGKVVKSHKRTCLKFVVLSVDDPLSRPMSTFTISKVICVRFSPYIFNKCSRFGIKTFDRNSRGRWNGIKLRNLHVVVNVKILTIVSFNNFVNRGYTEPGTETTL